MIAAIVVPSRYRSSARTASCLVAPRVVDEGALPLLVSRFALPLALARLALVLALPFDILRSFRLRRR